jgi:TrmH family RNA methyltransferase
VAELGARNRAVARLRSLLRDRRAREREQLFVAEGPHLVAAAREHGAPLVACYVAADAPPSVVAAVRDAGVPVHVLGRGVAERIADTVTSQGVFALVRLERSGIGALARADLAVVGAPITDPGNAGTLMRSAWAAGAGAMGLGSGSVDAYNPKVVRASAGACFAIPTVEGEPAVEMLEALGAQGVQRLGATSSGGRPPESFDLTVPTAFVLGHEARGLDPGLPLDDLVTIPMCAGESLNVAMAGTVLLFEAARQRRS